MAAHHLERPARAVGHAIDVDACSRPTWRSQGRPRRRPAPACVYIARSILRRSKPARQRTRISRSCCSVTARRRALAGSLVRGIEAVEVGLRAAGAALAQDDDVAAAADDRPSRSTSRPPPARRRPGCRPPAAHRPDRRRDRTWAPRPPVRLALSTATFSRTSRPSGFSRFSGATRTKHSSLSPRGGLNSAALALEPGGAA